MLCAICHMLYVVSVLSALCLLLGGWHGARALLLLCFCFWQWRWLLLRPPSRHFAGHVPKCLAGSMETWKHGNMETWGLGHPGTPGAGAARRGLPFNGSDFKLSFLCHALDLNHAASQPQLPFDWNCKWFAFAGCH